MNDEDIASLVAEPGILANSYIALYMIDTQARLELSCRDSNSGWRNAFSRSGTAT